jgi:hypothetical protein
MKLIRTYELNFKLNDELVFEGVANMFDTSIGLMYNIDGCGLKTGKYLYLRDAKKAIKKMVTI